MTRVALLCLVLCFICGPSLLYATETEHIGMKVLPAPGRVVVDGKFADWDLTGGIFVCSDVENMRDKFSVWFATMYDDDNLYLLARWNDETPLNNPGSRKGNYGFAGDCLQFRTIVPADDPNGRCGHWDCWQDCEGIDQIEVQYGTQFDQGKDKNVKLKGARQAFVKNPDGKGYVQEIALPWKLAGPDGYSPKPGDKLQITVEPNFTIGTSGRLSLKDIFKPNMPVDRVFTFMASRQWGIGTLEARSNREPTPVRISDGREFAVSLEEGVPAVDWTGLIKSKELKGFETIELEMPDDGYVSLIIRNRAGQVVLSLIHI